jgi:uncharacterized protein YecE (DUF72 family)
MSPKLKCPDQIDLMCLKTDEMSVYVRVKRKGKLYIGTSGWIYKDWHDLFYPKEMKKDFLSYLSSRFSTVEINSSFYHLPKESTFLKWYEEVPRNFKFSVKMNRYITHRKKLKDVTEETTTFIKRSLLLKSKLGVILVQLPPSLGFKEEKMRKFFGEISVYLKKHNQRVRIALEPRHRSWFLDENIHVVRKICKHFRIALVWAQSSKFQSFDPVVENITSSFLYLRFHGPKQFAASLYGHKGLKPWVDIAGTWLQKGYTVFVYFNNDIHGYAIKDALEMKKMARNHKG